MANRKDVQAHPETIICFPSVHEATLDVVLFFSCLQHSICIHTSIHPSIVFCLFPCFWLFLGPWLWLTGPPQG